jgi:hypothetical protein
MSDLPRAVPDQTQKENIVRAWRDRYQGSIVQDFVYQLGAIDFSDRIILFGSALLLLLLEPFVRSKHDPPLHPGGNTLRPRSTMTTGSS